MTIKFTNNATTTLASGINSSATSLTVASGAGALFPSLSGSDVFYVTLANLTGTVEIVKVTARSSDTFTIVRGQDNTTAAAWLTGDKVELRPTAGILNTFVQQDPAAPSTFGFKNRIINGAMMIDQRNAGASVTIAGGASPLGFGPDRWQIRSAGANASAQQVTVSGQKRLRFTGASSVSAVAAHQRIEAANSFDLAGSAVTASFKASSTSLTSLTVEIYAANSTDTFGTWASPSVTLLSQQTVTISSSESTVSISTTIGSSYYTGLEVRIIGGALGAAQTLTIGDVQLEKGSTATSFDFRSIGTELALCQRYFETSYPLGTAVGTATQNGQRGASAAIALFGVTTTRAAIFNGAYSVSKRVAPNTLTLYDPNVSNGSNKISGYSSATQYTVSGTSTLGNTGLPLYITTTTGTQTELYTFQFAADSEL